MQGRRAERGGNGWRQNLVEQALQQRRHACQDMRARLEIGEPQFMDVARQFRPDAAPGGFGLALAIVPSRLDIHARNFRRNCCGGSGISRAFGTGTAGSGSKSSRTSIRLIPRPHVLPSSPRRISTVSSRRSAIRARRRVTGSSGTVAIAGKLVSPPVRRIASNPGPPSIVPVRAVARPGSGRGSVGQRRAGRRQSWPRSQRWSQDEQAEYQRHQRQRADFGKRLNINPRRRGGLVGKGAGVRHRLELHRLDRDRACRAFVIPDRRGDQIVQRRQFFVRARPSRHHCLVHPWQAGRRPGPRR